MTPLGTVKPSATVLARADDAKKGEPMLVFTEFGKSGPQVPQRPGAVFAGDTTWRAWPRTPETLAAYERFWKQTMLWLACQENSEGSAWIKLDARRLSAGIDQRLGFNVGLRGKGGVELKNAEFKATVIGPEEEGRKVEDGGRKTDVTSPPPAARRPPSFDVPIMAEDDGRRGYFLKTDTPGEYRVKVVAKGKDSDGKDIESEADARFLIAAEDLETLRPAANHDFLRKLAHAGGGQFFPADEKNLLDFLHKLTDRKQTRTSVDVWPDWRCAPPAYAGGPPTMIDQLTTLWTSAALPCLILFVCCLSLEWYLRRHGTWCDVLAGAY